jgi:para-aminobenzoate synthetase/4-amino-4-deoxychorismate lyase
VAYVRFDDLRVGSAFELRRPAGELAALEVVQVPQVLAAAERAAMGGAWVAGFVAYEAASAFDDSLTTGEPAGGLPLAWFGLFDERVEVPIVSPPVGERSAGWVLNRSEGEHAWAVERIKQHLVEGDTYQVNLTVRARSQVSDPYGLYAVMATAQGGAYNAYINTGAHAVVCASPELFFEQRDGRLVTRPMKGTRRRGRWRGEDQDRAEDLLGSGKDRSEHVMIVDLLRNDLGRIARPGTVGVSRLFDLERYGTVWQLTSTISADSDAPLVDIFAALFPSGSVTGAPKASTMAIIKELEDGPRGVYCGTVGYLSPAAPGLGSAARFAVAIRTATVEVGTGAAQYGSGGGITWSSDPEEEWQELQDKCAVLQNGLSPSGLFETLRYDPATGPVNWARHLDRLVASARYFAIPIHETETDRALRRALMSQERACRVRVNLSADGTVTFEVDPLPPAGPGPVRLAVAAETVYSHDVRLFHKTFDRTRYQRIRDSRPDVDDVVITNEAGHVTETTVANLAVRLDPKGPWWTPPLTDGLLPGVERQRLIQTGKLAERTLTTTDLHAAHALAVINSLRGWRPAVLTGREHRD